MILFMDKNIDYNYYGIPPFSPAGMGMYDMSGTGNFNSDFNPNSNTNSSPNAGSMPFGFSGSMESTAMFNPLFQYEQAYMYYRYLSMQMEYKIKCKEYEKLNSRVENTRENIRDSSRENSRRIE